MFRDIVKKEILDNLLTFKFVFTFALCTILILLSVYTGIANYAADRKEYIESVAAVRQGLNPPNYWSAIMATAFKIYRPPQALGTIANGVEGVVGRVSNVGTWIENNLAESKYLNNPLFGIFGALDLMSIVKIVLSLLGFLFAYDAIVGEKEKGTLKLALANNIPRYRLILGKAAGGLVSLLIPLIVPLLFSVIILAFSPNLALSREDWIRLWLIFLMFLLYLSVFFSLGLLISAMTSRSSTSFIILLFIWVVFVMVIPKAAVVAAGKIRPVPTSRGIATEKGLFILQLQEKMNAAMGQRMGRLNPELSRDRAAFQKAIMDIQYEIQDEFSSKSTENNARIDRDYQLKKDAQQSLAINLSRISPASALTFGSMSLARTGIDEYNRFVASARVYRGEIRKWYNTERSLRDPVTGAGKQISPDTLAIMPQYSHQPESLGASLSRALPDFGLLIMMTAIFFAGACFAFLRYDVR